MDYIEPANMGLAFLIAAMMVFLGWIALFIWAINIAESKGRKKMEAFLLVLFFGIFGVLIEYMLPKQ